MATRNTVVLRGNERIYGGGQRAWRSVVYEPTGRYPNYRIMFKARTTPACGSGRPAQRSPKRKLGFCS
ncbi:MAG: hypothetical protein QOK11_1252, partial [Pseudonocardiales bacterium]|nr:hypothetical protein [Pseudonocardiales bacterium]